MDPAAANHHSDGSSAQAKTMAEDRNSNHANGNSNNGRDPNNSNKPPSKPDSSPKRAPRAERPEQRSVSFGNLEIRTYETILGDNPSCSGGPSLGLGWRYDPSNITARVDDYERLRAQLYGNYDARPEDLVLHRFEREAILINTGYTKQDLAESVRGINKVKNRRRQTLHNLPVAWVEERVEVCRRTLRRVMLKKERTRHLYDEWKKSQGVGGAMNTNAMMGAGSLRRSSA